MNPVLLNVSIAGCHPFPALMHNGRVLALAWWNVDELREVESVEQLVKRWQRVGPAESASSAEIADFLARRARFDEDLWAIELDIAEPERFIAETTSAG